ncbi:MAG TPA: tRNA 4-thiouridine(8) synthase ThiI [bacterium]|nr:tRNA 4-thiouridine(8) synthase ThiI [bacterium]
MNEHKALGLYSGGLDSILSSMIIKEQGIEVHLLNFVSPFFNKIKKIPQGMFLHEYPLGDDYIKEVISEPIFGKGASLNACVDCHIFMLKKAKTIMKEIGADFVFTGEVVGQRPMSQTKKALHIVEQMSGLEGYLVRPLSAKLLKPTVPEINGILDRDKLLNMSGRGRQRQRELAKQLGVLSYPQPAGGCRFTDPNIISRSYLIEKKKDLDWLHLSLVLLGRHFCLDNGLYLIVSRNDDENDLIRSYASKGCLLTGFNNEHSVVALLFDINTDNLSLDAGILSLCGSIVSKYLRKPEDTQDNYKVEFLFKDKLIESGSFKPAIDEILKKYLL